MPGAGAVPLTGEITDATSQRSGLEGCGDGRSAAATAGTGTGNGGGDDNTKGSSDAGAVSIATTGVVAIGAACLRVRFALPLPGGGSALGRAARGAFGALVAGAMAIAQCARADDGGTKTKYGYKDESR